MWWTQRAVVVVGTMAMALSTVAVPAGVAATPAPTKTYKACANKDTGAIRLVVKGKKCKRSEIKLAWNVQGPAGMAGPVGPQGPTGATGPAGPAGPAGVPATAAEYAVVMEAVEAPADSVMTVTTTCPAGLVAVSGILGPEVNPVGFLYYTVSYVNIMAPRNWIMDVVNSDILVSHVAYVGAVCAPGTLYWDF